MGRKRLKKEQPIEYRLHLSFNLVRESDGLATAGSADLPIRKNALTGGKWTDADRAKIAALLRQGADALEHPESLAEGLAAMAEQQGKKAHAVAADLRRSGARKSANGAPAR